MNPLDQINAAQTLMLAASDAYYLSLSKSAQHLRDAIAILQQALEQIEEQL